jgi:hypothetical protein
MIVIAQKGQIPNGFHSQRSYMATSTNGRLREDIRNVENPVFSTRAKMQEE